MGMTVSRTHYKNNARPCDSWWRYLEDEMNVEMIGPQRVRHSIAGRETTKARDEAAYIQGPLQKVWSSSKLWFSKKKNSHCSSYLHVMVAKKHFYLHVLYIYIYFEGLPTRLISRQP